MIRMIATTTSSSIKENPSCFLLMSVPQLSLQKTNLAAYIYRHSEGHLREYSKRPNSGICLFLRQTQERRAKKKSTGLDSRALVPGFEPLGQGLKPIAYCSAGLATVQATPAVS